MCYHWGFKPGLLAPNLTLSPYPHPWRQTVYTTCKTLFPSPTTNLTTRIVCIRRVIINADKKYIKYSYLRLKWTHYGNGQIVLDNLSKVRVTAGEGRVRRSDISPPFKAFNKHHHVLLNPVCHRTTKEKGMAIDCRKIDYQTGSALQYNWVIILFG